MPHPLIILLTLGGMMCAACAFSAQVLMDRKKFALAEWVRSQHPEAWNELPGWMRKWASAPYFLASPLFALSALARRSLGRDRAFLERYAEIHRMNRRIVAFAMLGLGLACVAILGTRVWGWKWS